MAAESLLETMKRAVAFLYRATREFDRMLSLACVIGSVKSAENEVFHSQMQKKTIEASEEMPASVSERSVKLAVDPTDSRRK